MPRMTPSSRKCRIKQVSLTICHLSFPLKLSVLWDKTCVFMDSLRQERLALDPTAFWGAAGIGEQITPCPLHSDTMPAARACLFSMGKGNLYLG